MMCFYCDFEATPQHRDHVVPRSRGGPDTPDNIVIACAACNQAKSDQLPSEWSAHGLPAQAYEIERRISERVEVSVRAGRGPRKRAGADPTVDARMEPEAYYRRNAFERRLKVLNCGGVSGHVDDAVHVHDTMETALAIAKSIFGTEKARDRVVDVYDRLERARLDRKAAQ